MKTMQNIAKELNAHPEAVRSFVRRRESLAGLGRVYGTVRLYTADEAKAIREAFEQRAALVKT